MPVLTPTPLPQADERPVVTTRSRGQRTSCDQKLAVIGLGASRQATLDRLNEFYRLFAYRYTGGIVTRVGQGPRAWTKLPERLSLHHVIRHLAGNRIPGLEPIWFGARSLSRSRWFCIDVDADRSPEQILAQEYDLTNADDHMKARLLAEVRRTYKPKPPFADRLAQVETALRRMGVNPADPRQVLSIPSPSGGRHLYVFLDVGYDFDQIYAVLAMAGLKHIPGETEFFPAVNRGLRLPFGHMPNGPFDPAAWIQFIDDYRNRVIRRFSLAELLANLDKHRDRWSRQAQSVRRKRAEQQSKPSVGKAALGVPKARTRCRQDDAIDPANGIRSVADAEALFAAGIRQTGTRNQILNLLTAHLVWFRGCSADAAATNLITWTTDPRHVSKDIREDVARGTRFVANQIERMCRWYEKHRRGKPSQTTAGKPPMFAAGELVPIREAVVDLPPSARKNQADFLLHLLHFAKNHGTPTDDGDAWDAAPAAAPIMRRWPGCHHMNYKPRREHAVASGVLSLVRKERRSRDGTGRARTYRLHVPVVDESDETLTYEQALTYLTAEGGLVPQVEAETQIAPAPERPTLEATHARYRQSPEDAQNNPAAVPETDPDRGLGPRPHQRNQKPDAAAGVRRRTPGRRTTPRPRRRRGRHINRIPRSPCGTQNGRLGWPFPLGPMRSPAWRKARAGRFRRRGHRTVYHRPRPCTTGPAEAATFPRAADEPLQPCRRQPWPRPGPPARRPEPPRQPAPFGTAPVPSGAYVRSSGPSASKGKP
jgi:hypothetical protein